VELWVDEFVVEEKVKAKEKDSKKGATKKNCISCFFFQKNTFEAKGQRSRCPQRSWQQ